MGGTVRMLASVFKLRIGFAIMLCALAGSAVSPLPADGGPGAGAIAVLGLAVLLASAAAGAFNQYAERDLDARMRRTRARPFVTGRLRAGPAWPLGIGLLLALAVASSALATNAAAAAYVFLGAFTYGVVYTLWLKRRTVLNIVVGGAAGSFAVLAGAAAIDPDLSPSALVLAVVLFLWTPPHFWALSLAYRDQYAEAEVPMLPVVVGAEAAARIVFAHTLVLVLLALVPFFYGQGLTYLAGALAGGAYFGWESWRLMRSPTRERALAAFRASLAQLGLLLIAALLDGWVVGA